MDALDLLSKYQTIFVWAIGSVIFVFITLLATKFVPKSEFETMKGNVKSLEDRVNNISFDLAAVKDGHGKLKEAFDKVAMQITVLHTKVEQLPTDETISELKVGMERLEGRIDTALEKFERTDALIDRLENQVNRMDNFLLRSAT